MIVSVNTRMLADFSSFARNRSPADQIAKLMLLRGLSLRDGEWIRDERLPELISEGVARVLLEAP